MSSTVTSDKAMLNLSTVRQKEVIRKILTKEDMDDMKTSIANNLMRLNDFQIELDEIKQVYKNKMKPLEKDNSNLLRDVRNGFIDETLEVSLVPDYDNKIMELYNDEGVKVGERRMMISEMQGRLELK